MIELLPMTTTMEIHVKHQKIELPNKRDVGPMLNMEKVNKSIRENKCDSYGGVCHQDFSRWQHQCVERK
jgi:hypothetical protein